jgi:hypothetical protein
MPSNYHRRCIWAYEALAAAMQRAFPELMVEGKRPVGGSFDDVELTVTGGTPADRAAVLEWAEGSAHGWTGKTSIDRLAGAPTASDRNRPASRTGRAGKPRTPG